METWMADIARPDLTELRQRDRLEFRLLLWASFAIFLVVALFGRLLPRALRPFRSTGKSVIGEAWEAANTIVPFAFMR
jgi:hypothetical protein